MTIVLRLTTECCRHPFSMYLGYLKTQEGINVDAKPYNHEDLLLQTGFCFIFIDNIGLGYRFNFRLGSWFSPVCRRLLCGVIWPHMFRVSSFQFLFYFKVGSSPKAAKIGCYLHWLVSWRKQMEQ